MRIIQILFKKNRFCTSSKSGNCCFMFLLLLILFDSTAMCEQTSNSSSQDGYVIGRFGGRLGNIFFQVAAVSAHAWDHGLEAYFPDFIRLSWYFSYYNDIFFKCNIQPPSEVVEYTHWTAPLGYTPIPFYSKMEIIGYSQNEKYFAHHRKRLLELFAPKTEILNYIKNKYYMILNHPNSVSIHVRCYQIEEPNSKMFIQMSSEYFRKAMALFPEDALFIVMSDNIGFAKKIITQDNKKNVTFIEGEPYYIDFFLQSLCKHNIISNSTFSWWSAWLNQNPSKTVVRPDIWLGGHPDIGGPDEWIKIGI